MAPGAQLWVTPPLHVDHPQRSASQGCHGAQESAPERRGRGGSGGQGRESICSGGDRGGGGGSSSWGHESPSRGWSRRGAGGHVHEGAGFSTNRSRGGACGWRCKRLQALVGDFPSGWGGRGWDVGTEAVVEAPSSLHITWQRRFLHKHSWLWNASFPSPKAVSSQPTAGPSPGLLSKSHVPAPAPPAPTQPCAHQWTHQTGVCRAVARPSVWVSPCPACRGPIALLSTDCPWCSPSVLTDHPTGEGAPPHKGTSPLFSWLITPPVRGLLHTRELLLSLSSCPQQGHRPCPTSSPLSFPFFFLTRLRGNLSCPFRSSASV